MPSRWRTLAVPLDQVVYSAATFATTVVVARNLAAPEFGVFALFVTAAALAIGLQRASLAEPLLVLTANSVHMSVRSHITRMTFYGLICGATYSIAASCVLWGVTGQPISLLGSLILIGPFLQDAMRFAWFALRRPLTTILQDVLCSLAQVSLLSIGPAFGIRSVEGFLLLWGAGATLGLLLLSPWTLFASRKTRGEHAPSHSAVFSLARNYGMDYLLGAATSQVTLFVASLVGTPLAAAALRGSDTMVAPFRILLQSAPATLLGRWSKSAERARIRRHAVRIIGVLWLGAAIWVVLLIALPSNVGRSLLGASWPFAAQVVPYIAASLFPITVSAVSAVGLKALGLGSNLVRLRLILAPISIVVGVGGALVGAAKGAAIGALAVSTIAAVMWGITFFRKAGQP